jgi:hypothetical protein
MIRARAGILAGVWGRAAPARARGGILPGAWGRAVPVRPGFAATGMAGLPVRGPGAGA